MVLPWQRHRQETEALQAKLEVESQQVNEARAQTFDAVVGQARSRTNSGVLLRQLEVNGWTELLQAAWRGKA